MTSTGAKIFIAWSKDTEDAAGLLRDYLKAQGLSPWMSDEIQPGRSFRQEIRKSVLDAHLVISLFRKAPSHWQVAEAGLAYFEQKLIPVAVDSDIIVEPFSDLQTHVLKEIDLTNKAGPSLDGLLKIVNARLGSDRRENLSFNFYRAANNLFFHGVPLVGIAIVCLLLLNPFTGASDQDGREFWKAGHTVFGAIVYGGGAFVALLFSRSGTSTSFSERRFGFHTARRLFFLWFVVAVFQLLVGLILWMFYSPGYPFPDTDWLTASVFVYLVSLIFWGTGYLQYSTAYRLDKEQAALAKIHKNVFAGNLLFGIGLLSLTLVIVLMSLKNELGEFLQI